MEDNATDTAMQAQHAFLVEQFRSGELRDKVKVILILGYAGAGKSNLLKLLTGIDIHVGHGMESGTLNALCVLTTLGDEPFVFIDTPGFGATGSSESRVISTIRSTLGFATRCFGGIHGILYVHNIMTEREYEGMTQSLEFLRSLKMENRLPSLTFVTTNWDLVPTFLEQDYQDKLSNLRDTWWNDFTDYGYIELGFRYDHYPAELRGARRNEVVTQLVDRYTQTRVVPITMPFWEWTWEEIISGISNGSLMTVLYSTIFVAGAVTAPVWMPLLIIGASPRSGNVRIGITSTGNLFMSLEGSDLGRTLRGDIR